MCLLFPTSQVPPATQGQGGPAQSPGLRARSATYIAKGAVADVTRRFHPEQAEAVGWTLGNLAE